ncbi:uncharacterized protein LOC110067600 [Orbicella faveolata]|uniref:uncharacterized protein LOC110067600 n=1 Tax=Orbicella faveolata TaxID=48498 RepID=UPI0009E4E596|nr:uncharacterized protein LOC110067600 [Orbicella faveolata]
MKQIVQSRILQGQLFKMLSKQCENDESEENSTQTFGLPSDGRQRQAVDVLRCLIYTAAGIGAEGFVRMIFSTSAGGIIFEAYKKESPLPENIADANGHEEIATFLRVMTKRFSEGEMASHMRSEGINWDELARAVEESEKRSVTWPSEKDAKQLLEDDTSEREYFGDAETSSTDSEKERFDYDDQFKARVSKVSVTEQDVARLASDISLENNCCDAIAAIAEVYNNRATAHFCLGNFQESLSDAAAAINLEPTLVKAIERGARACIKLKRYEEALTWCDKGLAIDKNNRTLLNLWTRILSEPNPSQETERQKMKSLPTTETATGLVYIV